jgi:CheY-like chemotaxis protein
MSRKTACAIIDDDPDWIDLVRRCLMKSPHLIEPVEFTEAAAALDYLHAHSVDFVVTDLRMPGMDGLMFIAELRLFDPTTPVIMVSSDEPAAQSAIAAGANAFVRKRELNTTLTRTVDDLLANGETLAATKESDHLGLAKHQP